MNEKVSGQSSNFLTFGSELKEKFSNLFKNKKKQDNKGIKESESPTRSTLNRNLERKVNDTKNLFTIQEDDDHQIYNYNLDIEDDDYEDLIEDQEEEINKDQHHLEIKEKEDFSDEEYLELHNTCHRLYTKDSLIDIQNLLYFNCTKMKPVNTANKLFSYIGLSNSKLKEEPYLFLIDENFIYILKDFPIDKNDPNIRRVKNHLNIKCLTSIDIKKYDEIKLKISLVFILNKSIDNYISKVKEFYLKREEKINFIKILKKFFTRYKIEVTITESK